MDARPNLKFNPALVVIALAHGDIAGGFLPLDLACLVCMLDLAPLQKLKDVIKEPTGVAKNEIVL